MTHEEIVDSCIDKFVRNAHERDCIPKLRSELKEALTTYRTQVLEEVEKIVDNIEIKEQGSLDYIHSQELKETLMKLKHPTN